MEIYLLRHGQSEANVLNLVCGQLDYPLTQNGIAQAATACNYLKTIGFDRVYSSSLSRAIHTVKPLMKEVDVQVYDQLMELDTGDVSHITLQELRASDARYRRPWLFPDLRHPGGETFREMIIRISAWFDIHSKSWRDGEKILIVGHEGTLRVIYLKLMGLKLDEYPDFPIGNCEQLYFMLNNGRVIEHRHLTLNGEVKINP
ncbi:histidine phosphatase family protein [Rhodoferax sp. GW822-FHT02A01]|uniref:histidine phosphatase family protein n=1 Tax=Rhodoferax sp. GW822-FHT02A01 TaxID=3141537 RepID=UPI00315D35C0